MKPTSNKVGRPKGKKITHRLHCIVSETDGKKVRQLQKELNQKSLGSLLMHLVNNYNA